MGNPAPALLSDEEAVRLADQNYAHSFRLLGRHAKGGAVQEEPGVLSAITGQIPWLNVTVVFEELADPKSALARALDFYARRGAGFVVRIRVGFDPRAEEALRELGLQRAEQLPGMVLNPMAEPAPLPAGLAIVDCDAASFPIHNEIVAAVFGMPLEMANDLLTPPLFGNPGVRGYLGYLDGRPVATSVLIASHSVVGVYNVATLAECRGRGIGEAMTWHAVRQGAKAGCVTGSLQASEMGQPVYARMGFRNIAPYESYVRQEPNGR